MQQFLFLKIFQMMECWIVRNINYENHFYKKSVEGMIFFLYIPLCIQLYFLEDIIYLYDIMLLLIASPSRTFFIKEEKGKTRHVFFKIHVLYYGAESHVSSSGCQHKRGSISGNAKTLCSFFPSFFVFDYYSFKHVFC